MKKDILIHCECETTPDSNGNKSAWRLRLILEGMAMCCRCSKREEASRYRKLALFERLTTNDMPNWSTEPTQPATPAEAPQISTESAEATNVSAEGEIREISRLITLYGFGFSTAPDNANLWRLYRDSKPITDYMTINQLSEWLRAYSQKQITSKEMPPKSAPQSTLTPRTVKCITRPRERRQRANKQPKTASQCLRTTRHNTLRDTLRSVTYVPRRCSTANSPPIGRPQLTPYW